MLWVLAGLAPVAAQDFEKGKAAAHSGNYVAAIAEWLPLAREGNVDAQFNLGAIYEAGLGGTADPKEAARWYAMAAGQGDPRAQYNLGVMFAEGRGLSQDDTRAAIWWRRAAEQSHGKAQYNLGVLYWTGRGLPKDVEQARSWFRRASANGVAPKHSVGSVEEPRAGAPAGQHASQGGEALLKSENAPVEMKSIGLSLVDAADVEATDIEPAADAVTDVNVASRPVAPLRISMNFPEDARYRLEVSEIRERRRDGVLVSAQTSTMHVEMVTEPGPGDGVLIRWTYGPAAVKSTSNISAGLLENALGKLIDGQEVAYHTDREGRVIKIDDPSQLISFYEKSIDRILEAVDPEDTDPDLIAGIRQNLAPLLSPNYAAARALELPRMLHFFSGLEMTTGEIYHREGQMSLPPSAEALASTVDYELKWFDRAAGVAWLHWKQSADADEAAGAISAYISTQFAQLGQEMPDKFNVGAVTISDDADYQIELTTGLPKQVIYTRTVELFGFTQTEKRRIRVLR